MTTNHHINYQLSRSINQPVSHIMTINKQRI